jgi:hypothetical protein
MIRRVDDTALRDVLLVALTRAGVSLAAFGLGALIATRVIPDGPPSVTLGDLLIALGALAAGLQTGAMMRLGVRAVFTTALTATWTALSSDVARRFGDPEGGFMVLTQPKEPHELADLNPTNDNTPRGVSDGIYLLQIAPQRR